MRDALLTAAGACLVAVLNEVRASLRARQADRDRREALIAAALALTQREAAAAAPLGDVPPTEQLGDRDACVTR